MTEKGATLILLLMANALYVSKNSIIDKVPLCKIVCNESRMQNVFTKSKWKVFKREICAYDFLIEQTLKTPTKQLQWLKT